MLSDRMIRYRSFALPCFVALISFSAQASPLAKTVSCGGATYRYLLTPNDPTGTPAPAVLLLHGAGGHPEEMVDAWKKFAEHEHIVLIAPELPRKAEFEAQAPDVFRCVMEDARHFAAIDSQRLYVFGYSMGGYLVFDAAMFDSEYFAAVGVYGMIINPDYYSIVDRAKRKTPIVLLIGDRDPTLTLEQAHRTRNVLSEHGFPLRYEEIGGHDHNYWADSDRINGTVWHFFREHPLPETSVR